MFDEKLDYSKRSFSNFVQSLGAFTIKPHWKISRLCQMYQWKTFCGHFHSSECSQVILLPFVLTGDICLPKKGQRQSLKIEQRFHFSSALKRMSVIISMQLGIASNSQYLVTAKGAPETLKAMVSEYVTNRS